MHLAVLSPVYCHPDWRGSGVGRASMDLTLALAERGHTIELICPLTDAEHRFDEPAERRLADGRIRLHPVPQAQSSRYGTSGHGVAAVLDPILEKVEVLHIHGFFSGITDVAARRARATGVPYVIQPHGKLAPAFLANRHLQKTLYLKWRGLAHLRDAAAVITLARAIAGHVEALDPLIKTAVCPNGLDPQELEGPVPASPLDTPYLLFFGWLDPRKNVDLLIRAFARAGGGVDGWKLALVGPDGYGHAGSLRKLVDRTGLDDRVVFPGMVRGEEKTAWLKNAGLFLLPSKGEGLSVAMLEALACGVPCLLSPGCNYAEIEEGAGAVVAPNEDAWASAMVEWIGSEERRAAAASGARALFEEHHTLPVVGARLERILLEASGRAAADARCA